MRDIKRSALQAVGPGIAAGAIFAAVGVIHMGVRGVDPFLLFRLFASLVMGRSAYDNPELGVVLVGALTNIVVSGAAGFVYGAAAGMLPEKTRSNLLQQAGLGFAYGALLYLLDFQLIGRVLFPWVLSPPQLPIFVLHTLAFGVPLGVAYVIVERRLQGAGHGPQPSAA